MKAVLFDLDRTLVDVQSYTDYAAALADVEAIIGSWQDRPTPPTGWDGPTRRCMGVLVSLSGDPRWQRISDVIERHELAAISRSVAMPGLDRVASLEIPMAVVTLLPPGAARRTLDHHGIDITTLVGRRSNLAPKPAADQLLAACAELGVEPAGAVMVGDSTWDQVAAQAAGCDFIGLTNGALSEFPPGTMLADGLADLQF
jgi:phosphoglycolate phosphatase